MLGFVLSFVVFAIFFHNEILDVDLGVVVVFGLLWTIDTDIMLLLLIPSLFTSLLKLMMKIVLFIKFKHLQYSMLLLKPNNLQFILIQHLLVPLFDLKLFLQSLYLLLNRLIDPPCGQMERLALLRRPTLNKLR